MGSLCCCLGHKDSADDGSSDVKAADADTVGDDAEADVASLGKIIRCDNSPSQSPPEEQHEMVRKCDSETAEPDDAAAEDLTNTNAIEMPERRCDPTQILKTELRHTSYYFYNEKTGEHRPCYLPPDQMYLLDEAEDFVDSCVGLSAHLISMINSERKRVANAVYRSRGGVVGRYAGYRYAAVSRASYLVRIARKVWYDIAERPDGFVVRFNDKPYPPNVAIDKHAAKVYGCLTYYMPIEDRCMGPERLAEAIFHFWNNNGVARSRFIKGDKFKDFPCISDKEEYVADGTPACKIFDDARKDFQHQLLDSKSTMIGMYGSVVKAIYPVQGSSEICHENLFGYVVIFEHAVAEGADILSLQLEQLRVKEMKENTERIWRLLR